MNPDSRYVDADTRFVVCHTYDEGGKAEVTDEGAKKVEARAAVYRLPVPPYPDPPDTTYMANVTDTFPLLGKRLFNDSERWWVLAEANPQVRHPLDLKAADVLYIPT